MRSELRVQAKRSEEPTINARHNAPAYGGKVSLLRDIGLREAECKDSRQRF